MIERIADLPDGVQGFRARGTVTPSEYRETVLPKVNASASGGGRLLYVAGPDFEGYSGFGEPADKNADLSFHKIAFVTDNQRYGDAVLAFGWPFPDKAQVYPTRDFDRAVTWLRQ